MEINYKKLSLRQRAEFVQRQLTLDYPTVETPLFHKNAFELLIAVILSAQTKDDTVNLVTPTLFKNFPDSRTLANAAVSDIEKIIRTVNYYKTKAKNVIATAKNLMNNFNGEVPYKMVDLITLPGVGRKTANVIISEWFARHPHPDASARAAGVRILAEGFVVDTHVMRVSRKLLLTKNTKPEKVEADLMKIFKREDWPETSLRIIFHGRNVAQAKKPQWHTHPVWSKVYGVLG